MLLRIDDIEKICRKVCRVHGRMPYVGELKLEHGQERIPDVALFIIDNMIKSIARRADFMFFLRSNKFVSEESVEQYKHTYVEAEAYRVVGCDEKYIQLVKDNKIRFTNDYFVALYRLGYFRNSRIPEFILTMIGQEGRECYSVDELIDVVLGNKENIEERFLSILEDIYKENPEIDKDLIDKFFITSNDPEISLWKFSPELGVKDGVARNRMRNLGKYFYKHKIREFLGDYYSSSNIGTYRKEVPISEVTLKDLDMKSSFKNAIVKMFNVKDYDFMAVSVEDIMQIHTEKLLEQKGIGKIAARAIVDEIARVIKLHCGEQEMNKYLVFMRKGGYLL